MCIRDRSGPNGFSSNTENPVISNVSVSNNGGYTVEVTSANGCKAVSSIVVTNILPGVVTPTITTNSPVCEDENISLNILQSYAGSVSYNWTNGAGTSIGTGSNVTLAANDANAISPYVVQVTVDGCTSEFAVPVEVQVDELPTAVATNNGPICSGDQVVLSAGPVLGACLLYTSPSPRDATLARMPSSA